MVVKISSLIVVDVVLLGHETFKTKQVHNFDIVIIVVLVDLKDFLVSIFRVQDS